jgi:flagellar assembly protein FliH
MTSTSPDPVVLRDLADRRVDTLPDRADLRTGTWTRHGHRSALGDPIVEHLLDELAERTRAAAQAQGYAAGWAQGLRTGREHAAATAQEYAARDAAANAQRQAEHDQAMTALATTLDRLQAAFHGAVEQVTGQAHLMALEIAAAVIGRELTTSATTADDAVRRALAGVAAETPVVVRLHPDDAARVHASLLADRPVRIVADPSLAPGDAVAETEDTLVDATIAAALDRVRGVLAP